MARFAAERNMALPLLTMTDVIENELDFLDVLDMGRISCSACFPLARGGGWRNQSILNPVSGIRLLITLGSIVLCNTTWDLTPSHTYVSLVCTQLNAFPQPARAHWLLDGKLLLLSLSHRRFVT